jgi:hypothetical protein
MSHVELHLRRVIEEHITTLLNFPSNMFSAAIADNTTADQEGRILRLKAYTADQIEALEKLSKLVSELHTAVALRGHEAI